MTDQIRFATITVVYPTSAGNYDRPRNPSYNPARDTVQISSEAREKSREFLLKMRQESSVENTGSSSNQPQSTADILDLPANATKEQIRKAYITAVKKYHPDNFASFYPEFQKLAEERTKQINLAYRKANGWEA